MSYAFDFDLTNRILRCRLSGPVSDDLLQEFFQVGSGHAVRTHPAAGVVDLSEVTSFDVSSDTIWQLARSAPVLNYSDLRRIVIAPAPHPFGMMRMFAAQAEELRPNLHVVRSENEAWAILVVQNPQFKLVESN